MKTNNEEKWYYKIAKLLRLETTTPHGRVNLGGIVLLILCILLYSASDTIKHFISATEDTIKTIALRQDIHHPYETSNVLFAVLPVLIGFGFCLLYLYFHENKKEKILNLDNLEEEIEQST